MADNGNLLDDLFNNLNQEAGVSPFAPAPDIITEHPDPAIEQQDVTIKQPDPTIEQQDKTIKQQKEQQTENLFAAKSKGEPETEENEDASEKKPERQPATDTAEEQPDKQTDVFAREPKTRPEAEEAESTSQEEPEEHLEGAAPSFGVTNGGREDFKSDEGVQREFGVTMPLGVDNKTFYDLQHAFYTSTYKPEEESKEGKILPFQKKQ